MGIPSSAGTLHARVVLRLWALAALLKNTSLPVYDTYTMARLLGARSDHVMRIQIRRVLRAWAASLGELRADAQMLQLQARAERYATIKRRAVWLLAGNKGSMPELETRGQIF